MAKYRTGIVYQEGAPTAPPSSYGSFLVYDTLTNIQYRWSGTSWISEGLPYKEYVATTTQSGLSAPVATVMKNTLGGTVVWARVSEGVFTATLSGGFPADKTHCLVGSMLPGAPVMMSFSRTNDNVCTLSVWDDTGAVQGGLPHSIQIRVYV